MSNTRHFTDANFATEVLQSEQPVVVDFWASWCGPCRAVGPTIEKLADTVGNSVKVGKLNVDDNRQAAIDYDVQAIPTVLIFRDGRVVNRLIGVNSEQDYLKALEWMAA
jgi:thioredoxin 1